MKIYDFDIDGKLRCLSAPSVASRPSGKSSISVYDVSGRRVPYSVIASSSPKRRASSSPEVWRKHVGGDLPVLAPALRNKRIGEDGNTKSIATAIRSVKWAQNTGEGFKYNCPHRFTDGTKYTVAIDWLQVGATLDADVSDMGADYQKGHYLFKRREIGSKHYKYIYDVYIGNTHYYTVEATPRNGSGDPRKAVVKCQNWLFYSQAWLQEFEGFIALCTNGVERISRLDVAFDGLEHIFNLLCDWVKDKNLNYGVKLIGKSLVNAYDINKTTKSPNGFTIGTMKGAKMISCYNKTKDVKRLGKFHISEYWENNKLPASGNVHRFEVRMKNDFLKTVRGSGLNENTPENIIHNLADTNFLISLCQLAMVGLFEWVYMDNKNVTRCTRVCVLPIYVYDMERTSEKPVGTVYKAKMTVHNTYMQLCAGIVGRNEGIAIIKRNLSVYRLYDWYKAVTPKYSRLYVTQDGELKQDLFALALAFEATPDKNVNNRLREIYKLKHPPKSFDLFSKRNSNDWNAVHQNNLLTTKIQ